MRSRRWLVKKIFAAAPHDATQSTLDLRIVTPDCFKSMPEKEMLHCQFKKLGFPSIFLKQEILTRRFYFKFPPERALAD